MVCILDLCPCSLEIQLHLGDNWIAPFDEPFLKVKSMSCNDWFAIRDKDVAWTNFSLCLLDT